MCNLDSIRPEVIEALLKNKQENDEQIRGILKNKGIQVNSPGTPLKEGHAEIPGVSNKPPKGEVSTSKDGLSNLTNISTKAKTAMRPPKVTDVRGKLGFGHTIGHVHTRTKKLEESATQRKKVSSNAAAKTNTMSNEPLASTENSVPPAARQEGTPATENTPTTSDKIASDSLISALKTTDNTENAAAEFKTDSSPVSVNDGMMEKVRPTQSRNPVTKDPSPVTKGPTMKAPSSVTKGATIQGRSPAEISASKAQNPATKGPALKGTLCMAWCGLFITWNCINYVARNKSRIMKI